MRNKTIFRVAMCIIILSTFDEVLSYTLSVAKMNVSEFESPLGERYKESGMGIMREAMPLLVSRLQMGMGKELRPEIDRSTEVVDQTKKSKRHESNVSSTYLL